MLITTKLRSSTNLGSITFTVPELCPFITLYASRGIICVTRTHSPFIFNKPFFKKLFIYQKKRCGLIANETTLTRDQMTQKLTTLGQYT